MKMVERRRELRARGEPVPEDLAEQMTDEDFAAEDEEEEEDEDTTIIISDGEKEPAGGEEKKPGAGQGPGRRAKTQFFVFERFLHIRRPEGKLVRDDFGASWDPGFDKAGVRLTRPIPGSHADRSGFKEGDVIVAVGAHGVEKVRDVQAFFEDFKFEKEPAGERFVEFTVQRPTASGDYDERTVTVRWDPPVSARVDARWDKPDKTLHVLARHAKGLTICFTDEVYPPGEPFHLYINGVPYQDLVDPATRPDYPRAGPRADGAVMDELHRMRQKRAKVDGWQPEPKWALREALAQRDRGLILGGRMILDLTKMREGFEAAKRKDEGGDNKRGERVGEAYEAWKSGRG